MASLTDDQRNHYIDLYLDSVEHLHQQDRSLFAGSVMLETGLIGELVRVKKQYGATSTNKNRRGRGLDTPQNDTPRKSRWVQPNMFDWGDLIEDDDEIRKMGDSSGPLVEAVRKAFGRDMDDEIIGAFFASAITGDKEARTNVVFPTATQQVAADVGATADTGMNVEKLLAIDEIFGNADIDLDMEEKFIAISPKMRTQLLNDQRFTSAEFSKTARLEEGVLTGFLGFKFIQTTRSQTSGANTLTPAWIKSSMALGEWSGKAKDKASESPGKRFRLQLYHEREFGATRTQETGVVQVLNVTA
ncbi:MAG: phage capsid protein [Planctomycetota bacterium]